MGAGNGKVPKQKLKAKSNDKLPDDYSHSENETDQDEEFADLGGERETDSEGSHNAAPPSVVEGNHKAAPSTRARVLCEGKHSLSRPPAPGGGASEQSTPQKLNPDFVSAKPSSSSLYGRSSSDKLQSKQAKPLIHLQAKRMDEKSESFQKELQLAARKVALNR